MRVLAVDGGQSTIRVGYSDGRAPVELAGVSHQESDTVATVADAAVAGWRALGAPTADRAVLGASASARRSGWPRPRPADGSPLDGGLLLGAASDPAPYGALVHAWGAAA